MLWEWKWLHGATSMHATVDERISLGIYSLHCICVRNVDTKHVKFHEGLNFMILENATKTMCIPEISTLYYFYNINFVYINKRMHTW